MEDSSVFSSKLFFLIKAHLKKAKQRVCLSIYFILIIIDLKIIIRVLMVPIDLTKAQTPYIYKLLKVIIVNKNKNLLFAAF